MKIKQLSLTNEGAYVIWLVPQVARGMHGKTKGHVDEVLIQGIPEKSLQNWCVKNKIFITNKAVYNADTNEPILFKEKDSYTYVLKEEL